ncbi:MAG: hypothetical protein M5U01_14650 [Ardenticatenaceae bacterium]|nr:hypothetical protein [Ardenticatenaceae bacterium]
MTTVNRATTSVNHAGPAGRGPGQPTKQTPACIRAINRAVVAAALKGEALPADAHLAETLCISERTVRTIRLRVLGLNRHELKGWQSLPVPASPNDRPAERELLCATPFAGLWLLVPQIIDSGLARAAGAWQIVGRTRVQAIQMVLTLVAWAALGFQRLCHVDDFRHWADMGLALFTGGLHVWSDTTLWRWVHGLTPASAARFYEATASPVAGQPDRAGRFSVDDHVVPSFTKLRPRRLGKTRVPTRGRASPACRLYAPFDLDLGRFVGVIVRKARESLSQTALTIVEELRRLRRRAGVPHPEQVRVILDRGGYQGSVFEQLLDDPQVSFIAMARATATNVRQWDAGPERRFRPYRPAGDDNPNLKIARSQTTIRRCRYPVPSVVIRDDTPGTKQRGRVLFFKNQPGRCPHAETIDAEYRQRQNHELGFAQSIHALAGHSLPKAYEMVRTATADGEKRHTLATAETDRSQPAVRFVAWLKFLTFNLIKDFGAALGQAFAPCQVATLVRRFILRPGRLYWQASQLIVQLDPFRGQEGLDTFIQELNERRLTLPWLCNLVLQIEIAPEPQGLAAVPHVLGRRILANSRLAAPS